MITLTATHTDRAAGVMLGTACGDALGAGYEFGPPLDASTPVGMVGGGSFTWAPGEWTDDTSMAIVLLQEFAIETKKVKLVAAADPDSLSGKARKARAYGIPIVGEQGLAEMLERL